MASELSKAVTTDLAKSDFSNWLFELCMLEREIDHTLAHLSKWMKDECVDTPLMLGPGKSYLQREPLGVVAVLGSWNYPLATLIGPVISAISAGNGACTERNAPSRYLGSYGPTQVPRDGSS